MSDAIRVMPGYRVMTSEVDVALNLRCREYMNEWGERCEITDLYDEDGEWMDPRVADNHDMAVMAVARHPLPDHVWYTIDLRDFECPAERGDGMGLVH